MKLYTIYDSKAQAFIPPFLMPTDAEALRAFDDVVNDPSTMFNKHPEDYTLFCTGSFDSQTGILSPNPSPVSIATAISLKINLSIKKD